MSLEHAIRALEQEKTKLLREVEVIDQAIALIRGVTLATHPAEAAPAPNGRQTPDTASISTEDLIKRLLAWKGPLTLDEIIRQTREASREKRPEVIEALLYGLVKADDVRFLKDGRYGLKGAAEGRGA
jgi:hypothetical protein